MNERISGTLEVTHTIARMSKSKKFKIPKQGNTIMILFIKMSYLGKINVFVVGCVRDFDREKSV